MSGYAVAKPGVLVKNADPGPQTGFTADLLGCGSGSQMSKGVRMRGKKTNQRLFYL